MNKGTEILQRLFLLVLLVIVSGNLLAGAYGFLAKGGEVGYDSGDSFTVLCMDFFRDFNIDQII